MRRRNYFTYTFTPRVLAWLFLVTLFFWFAFAACTVGLRWSALGKLLAYIYVTFFAVFIVKSLLDYIKYRNF